MNHQKSYLPLELNSKLRSCKQVAPAVKSALKKLKLFALYSGAFIIQTEDNLRLIKEVEQYITYGYNELAIQII